MHYLMFALIYLIGCILSYGRITAMFYCIDAPFCHKNPPIGVPSGYTTFCITASSFIGFLIGTVLYFVMHDVYYIKFSNKPLWDIYYANNPNKQPKKPL